MQKAVLGAFAEVGVHIFPGGGRDSRPRERDGYGPERERHHAKMNPTMTPPAAETPANTAKTTAADVQAKGPDFINLQNSDMLSSNVVGLDIYNQQNNDIGKIQERRLRQFEEDHRLHPVRRRIAGHGNAWGSLLMD